jgi:hypothetical protein
VYKITNKINDKFYIGKHQTYNLDDGYMGSGKLIRAAIKKYGIENFTKDILFVFDNENDMNDKEKELVEPNSINEQSYNLNVGGYGGWNYINTHIMTDGMRMATSKKGGKASHIKQISGSMTESQRFWFYTKEGNRLASKRGWLAAYLKRGVPFKGQKHKEETKIIIGQKNSIHQQGQGNSQYGTCWITNGVDNKKIQKKELDYWLTLGYSRGRINGNIKIEKNVIGC